MDKYIEYLTSLPNNYLHIARSFATDNSSPKIEAAHLFRALLHKDMGLIDYIENTLDSDYYYLLDWADVRVSQAPKSAYHTKDIALSNEAKSAVKEAKRLAESVGRPAEDLKFLLAALVSPGVGFTADQIKTLPLSVNDIISTYNGGDSSPAAPVAGARSGREKNVSEDDYLTDLLKELPQDTILNFDTKIRSIVETLSRKDRANIIIVGETGVGKSSLIYGLLNDVRTGKIPASLKDLHPYELDTVGISQGVSYKGEVEDRIKNVLHEISKHPHPILVIENFNRVMDKQSVLGGILPLLKKQLAKNKLQVILTSTVDGYTKDIEKDKELLSYCEKITIEEPDENVSSAILLSKVPGYSEFHGIRLAEGVAEDIVRLAKRYMPEKCLPSSAIDLLDRTMASAKINIEYNGNDEERPELNKEYIRDVVAGITGLPIGNIQSEEREKLSNAEEIIHRRVVGQHHAVKSILDAIYESRSGLNKKGQPMGSFFFLGPTGTGKTELAKSLADFLFNDETAMLRFDMSEYKEEHSVALLYGAPPGYVGYEEGGLLVNQIRQHPYSVVLFDEIEKAHRSVFDLFLQILDEGKLHDRLGRVGDFSNALIIFTSNIGSDYIFRSFENKHIPTHDEMLEVMQGQFRPEFLARLTEILPFSPITEEMINKIFDIHIKNLVKSLDNQDIKLEIDDSAKQYITKVGFNTHYGARPVLGIIRKEIRRPLSKMIIAGDIIAGDTVVMKHDPANNEIVWEIDS